MTGENISSEAAHVSQHRHLQGEGAALAFQPQPMGVDVRIDRDRSLSSPVVATLEMGDNHFLIIDQGDQATEQNRDQYAVLNAIVKTDENNQPYYMPTVAVGTIGSDHNRLEIGRTDLQQRGFPHINDTMSRRHAAIDFHADGFVIRDHGGVNGTEVNFGGTEIPVDDMTVPRAELDRLRGTLLENVAQPVTTNEDVAEAEPWYVEAAREREQAVGEVAEDIGDVAIEQVVEAKPAVIEATEPDEPWYTAVAREREQAEQASEIAQEPSEEQNTATSETESTEQPQAAEQHQTEEEPQATEEQLQATEEPQTPETVQAPELETPTTQEIFASDESIEKTLRDPNVDPTVKTELQAVLNQWKQLQSAEVITETWNQDIQPQLLQLKEAAPALLNVVGQADNLRAQIQAGLIQIRDVLANRGGVQEISEVLNRTNMRQAFLDLEVATSTMQTNEDLTSAMTRLAVNAEDADTRIRQAQNRESLSPEDAEAFRNQFAEGIQAGVPLSTLRSELDQALSERRTPAWRQQKETIDNALMAARRATTAGDLTLAFNRLRDGMDMLSESARRGFYNEAEYDSVARGPVMTNLSDELEYMRNMLVLARSSTDQLVN